MSKKTSKSTKKKREVTPAAEWRKPREEGVEIVLPSGMVPKLRPVDMSVMLLDGTIPDLLSPHAVKALWMGSDVPQTRDEEAFDQIKEIAPDLLKLYNIITKAAFVYPRIVDNPTEDDEISLEDVDATDKASVFALVTQGATTLRFFRDQQSADVEFVPDGENVQSEAESDGGDN